MKIRRLLAWGSSLLVLGVAYAAAPTAPAEARAGTLLQ